MKTIITSEFGNLINSHRPESFNQDYWKCLYQRNAWLMQRWLNFSGAPFYYFSEPNTPLFISDYLELAALFELNEKYTVRYVEEKYWIVWRSDGYYFILTPHRYVDLRNSTDRFQPGLVQVNEFEKNRLCVQQILINIFSKNTWPADIDSFITRQLTTPSDTYAIIPAGSDDEIIDFYTSDRKYSVTKSSLLKWIDIND